MWGANSGLLHFVVKEYFVFYVGGAEFKGCCMKILDGKEEFSDNFSGHFKGVLGLFAESNLCKELGPLYFDIMGDHMWTSRGPACGRQGLLHEELQKAEIADVETFCMRWSMRSAFS